MGFDEASAVNYSTNTSADFSAESLESILGTPTSRVDMSPLGRGGLYCAEDAERWMRCHAAQSLANADPTSATFGFFTNCNAVIIGSASTADALTSWWMQEVSYDIYCLDMKPVSTAVIIP